MNELQTSLAFTFVSIFSMVNPIGMAPVFLEKPKDQLLRVRHYLAYKVATYGTLMLITALFAGPYVLRFFGISLADIEVAGGIFVFYTAWVMVTQPAAPVQEHSALPSSPAEDIAFFPLTMPITAGAGSLAISISLSSKIIHSAQDFAAVYAGAVLGIVLVFACVAICYRFSDAIFERIGRVGTNVLTRLTAFFLSRSESTSLGVISSC
jgi:multiple antibiotic resistance protein